MRFDKFASEIAEAGTSPNTNPSTSDRHFVSWPDCNSRVETSPDLARCNHGRVRIPGGMVSHSICNMCQLRGTEDSDPVVSQTRKDTYPSMLKRSWNVAAALAAFVADGGRVLSESHSRERLETCDVCDRRQGNHCGECGCRLSIKARGRAFACPIGKWPKLNGK